MESADAGAGGLVVNTAATEAKENTHNDVDAAEAEKPSQTKAKTEENATPDKKRRSSGRKSRCDIDIMEEAKAAYGELDSSEGRRLRKRPDPPKVETPPPAKRRSGGPGRKKAVKEDEDETAADNNKTANKTEKNEEKTDTVESKVDDVETKVENTSEQKEKSNETSPAEAAAPVLASEPVVEKPTGEVTPTSQIETNNKSNGDDASATVAPAE